MTSEPVGSKTLAQNYINTLSSATIRSALEEMEKIGYLYKPHTSAGRIPTEKSFRFFISEILKQLNEKQSEIEALTKQLETLKEEQTEFFHKIAKLLADMTNHVAIMLLPRLDYKHIKALDFFKLSSKNLMVVILFEHGIVEHKVIEVEDNFTQEQLSDYAKYINVFLEKGFSLHQIKVHLLKEMKRLKQLFDKLLDSIMTTSSKTVILEGQSNLFDIPEFSKVNEMKKIFKIFEEKSKIVTLLDSSLGTEGVKVFLGSELGEDLECAAMVAAPYEDGEHKVGTVGILGPVRMDYAKILPVVISVARLLSRNLSRH